MKKLLMTALIALAAVAFAPVAGAADVPFPASNHGDVFVIAQTTTTVGAMSNYFVPGDTVRFRAYAVDGKTHKVLTANAVRYFYATIPNQPNVKFKYDPKAPGATRAVHLDRLLDGSGRLPGRARQLQGPRPVEEQAPRLVRPDAGSDFAADDLDDSGSQAAQAPARRPGPAARSRRCCTPTA